MIWNIREVKWERIHFLTQRHLASTCEDIHFNYLEILASTLQSLFTETFAEITPLSDDGFNNTHTYLQVKIQVSISIQQLWMQAVNECNSPLYLSLEDHLPNLYPLVQSVQVHARLNPRLHPKLLCCFFESL